MCTRTKIETRKVIKDANNNKLKQICLFESRLNRIEMVCVFRSRRTDDVVFEWEIEHTRIAF